MELEEADVYAHVWFTFLFPAAMSGLIPGRMRKIWHELSRQ